MATFAAFYDANVLYPAELRSFLMHLATSGLFRAKWSAEVHEEWMGNLLRKRPDLKRAQLERTRVLMDAHTLDALVTGYEGLIPGLQLPDPDDRHVLAAAIRGRVDVIVTINLKDFPESVLGSFGIEAQHPDEFVVHLMSLSPGSVLSAARAHRGSLRNPPRTEAEYLDMLERQGLTQTASCLREYAGPFEVSPSAAQDDVLELRHQFREQRAGQVGYLLVLGNVFADEMLVCRRFQSRVIAAVPGHEAHHFDDGRPGCNRRPGYWRG